MIAQTRRLPPSGRNGIASGAVPSLEQQGTTGPHRLHSEHSRMRARREPNPFFFEYFLKRPEKPSLAAFIPA